MTTLHVELPDELTAKLTARAADAGFSSIERYAAALLQASTEGELDDIELEDLLAQRACDPRPGIEFTPAFAEEFRQQVNRRRGRT